MDREDIVRKFTSYRLPFKLILGWAKLVVRLVSFPVLRNIHPWVNPDNTLTATLPINAELSHEEIPLPEEVVHEFIDLASHRWIMNVCGCRHAYNCQNHSQDIGCLFMGRSVLEAMPGLGRLVSKEEAHEHVKKAVAQNLIPAMGKNKIDHFFLNIKDKGRLLCVCFCCDCCCIAGFFRDLPIAQLNRIAPPIKGLEDTVTDKCTGCGTCVDSCIYKAISIKAGKSVRSEYCRQCGRCVMKCPSGGVRITLNNQNFKQWLT